MTQTPYYTRELGLAPRNDREKTRLFMREARVYFKYRFFEGNKGKLGARLASELARAKTEKIQ